MRGAPSCSVRTTSRWPARATRGPPVPRRTEQTSESPTRWSGARPESRISRASHNARSSPVGDGIEQSQRSVSTRRFMADHAGPWWHGAGSPTLLPKRCRASAYPNSQPPVPGVAQRLGPSGHAARALPIVASTYHANDPRRRRRGMGAPCSGLAPAGAGAEPPQGGEVQRTSEARSSTPERQSRAGRR